VSLDRFEGGFENRCVLSLALSLAPVHLPEDLEFFEREVRPILIERCYRCHNSVDRREAGLALDHAAGLLEGGERGPAIVPGDPDASLLLRAVRHEDGAPRMPREEPKLEPAELEALTLWIASGAADPRDVQPTAEDLAAETSWEKVVERRLDWWAYQPIVAPGVPRVRSDWPRDDVDRFLLASGAVTPDDLAASTPEGLLRRASFVLTGLPPTLEEQDAFLSDPSEDAYERAVDRLLASPHYAERMARRWMDLVRYTESHGSEGDPTIPNIWKYRDYLIRAFDADVPVDRLIREHVAGDLLEPRPSADGTINEAALGPAHLRLVQHGYGSLEPLEEQIRYVDEQIGVIGKAFLGQTVSCARCHDHKFDPISQADYWAMYGPLASDRPAMQTIDTAEQRTRQVEDLGREHGRIRQLLAEAWLDGLGEGDLFERIRASEALLEETRKERHHSLSVWSTSLEAEDLGQYWAERRAEVEESRRRLADLRSGPHYWDLGTEAAREWFAHGSILEAEPTGPGAFAVLPDGDRILATLWPGGVYTHLLSSKHSGSLTSPWIEVEDGHLHLRAVGGGNARTRYVMEGYPRVSGPVYRQHGLGGDRPSWRGWNLNFWIGERTYLELTTARDIPVEARGDERSWWGIQEAVFVPKGQPGPREEAAEHQALLFEEADAPGSIAELEERHARLVVEAVEQWAAGTLTNEGVRLLDPLLRHGVLPTSLEELPELRDVVARYRQLEDQVPVPQRAPGVGPGPREDVPLYARGDFREPRERVPQRFFDWLDGTPYEGNGRLALARDLTRPDNVLTPRVQANRIWTWVFGEGLVSTVDNFGLLGAEPKDPALLDHLATRFVKSGWSTRELMRTLVTSSAFRLQQPAQRLDAESLRDALLAVSGRLDRKRFGTSVGEGTPRRSLYVTQRRTGLPPFLSTFDYPPPNTTCGRRPVTNVPAQGLALLNDPIVIESAKQWSRRAKGLETGERLERMMREAFGRPPNDLELELFERYLDEVHAARKEVFARQRDQREVVQRIHEERDALLALGRARALEDRGETTDGAAHLPMPMARWEFDSGLEDELGDLNGTLHGSGRVEGGRLVLTGGFVLTAPLTRPLKAKTLEAWVALEGLGQKGCGVVTVQGTDGGLFDSIVFAERQDRRWMAGSNGFQRTQDVGGPEEDSTDLVHLAAVYDEGGGIQLYRNGKPYGRRYEAGGPLTYGAGSSQVVLGGRHGTARDMRAPLRGAIERAAVYDRALSAEEVAASADGDPNFVSRAQLLAALDEDERARLAQLQDQDRAQTAALTEVEREARDSGDPWFEIAHSLFQLEEFRYLR